MSDRRAERPDRGGPWLEPGFWEDVEAEIADLDPEDFEAFVRADEGPGGPSPAFEAALRQRLLALFRKLY